MPTLGRREILAAGIAATGVAATGAAVHRVFGSSGSGSTPWPMHRYDAGNTCYAPDASGPRVSVGTAWWADDDGVLSRSIAVVDGTVYARWSSGGVVALAEPEDPPPPDPHAPFPPGPPSGDEVWRNGDLPPSGPPPAVAEGVVVVASVESARGASRSHLHGLDADDGSELWSLDLGPGRVSGAPTVEGGTIYLPLTADDPARTRVEAVDAVAGERAWTVTVEGTQITGTLAVADGGVYGAGDRERLCAVADGAVRWNVSVDGLRQGSVALDGDTLYAPVYENAGAADQSAAVAAIDAADAAERWRVTVPGRILDAPPAVTDDSLYVPGYDPLGAPSGPSGDPQRARLSAVSLVDRSVRWESPRAFATLSATPTATDDAVYAAYDDGTLVVHARSDGRPLWTHDVDFLDEFSPAVSGGRVYVGAGDSLTVVGEEDPYDHRW